MTESHAPAHGHAPHSHAAHEQHEEHPHVNYFLIFIALCVCTVLSIGVDAAKQFLTYGMLLTLVFIVAAAKATFVLLYFMHIRFEGAWKYILLAPTMILALALPFTLAPDIAYHYYAVQTTQRNEAAEWDIAHRAAAGHGKAEHAPAGEGAATHGEAAPATTHSHDAKETEHPAPQKP